MTDPLRSDAAQAGNNIRNAAPLATQIKARLSWAQLQRPVFNAVPRRLGRIGFLIHCAIALGLQILNSAILEPLAFRIGIDSLPWQALINGSFVFVLLTGAAIFLLAAIRRFHDFNGNALAIVLFFVFSFVPILILLLLIGLLLFPGNAGSNDYGGAVKVWRWEIILMLCSIIILISLVAPLLISHRCS